MATEFKQVNEGWNAEPNAPHPHVSIEGEDIVLCFLLNPFQFPQFNENDQGLIRFRKCGRYRLGTVNDEGWYRGQCRFSELAPEWGEFYELSGDLLLEKCPDDWTTVCGTREGMRHFLFYFRDEEFECDAYDWKLEIVKAEPSKEPHKR